MEHFDPSTIRIDLPCHDGPRKSFAEFGGTTQPSQCNTQAFRSALDFARANPGTVLEIPEGTYHFYTAPDDIHMPIHGMSDLTIDGQGSQLIFHTPLAYFDFLDSLRIWLKFVVLVLDWSRAPLASVGVVQAVALDGTYLDVTFPGAESVPEDMEIRIVGPFDPHRYSEFG